VGGWRVDAQSGLHRETSPQLKKKKERKERKQ
jgi:hypothetical protein